MRRKYIAASLALGALLAAGRPAGAATTTYNVTLNTVPLIGHQAGPFSIVVVTTDGSGAGDTNNTVTVSDVDFHGGATTGEPLLWGGASGGLDNTLTLTDDGLVNLFTQTFAAGQRLTFLVSVTSEADEGEVPDHLDVYLLDRTGARVPTLAVPADVLVGLDIGGTPALPDVFGSDVSRPLAGGGTLSLDAPIVRFSDVIAPRTTAITSPPPNAAGWNSSTVNVTLNATDDVGGTGVRRITFSTSGAQVNPPTTVPGDAAALVIDSEGVTTATFHATDVAGNDEALQTLALQIDRTAPTIGATRTPPNSNGWSNRPVVVTFQCVDNLSGLAAGSPPAPTTVSVEGVNQSANGTCGDVAGNVTTMTVQGISLDMTSPLVTYLGNRGRYTVDQVISIDCTATDPMNGNGTAASGLGFSTCAPIAGPAYGFKLGANTVTASAVDNAGNTTLASTTFTVAVTCDSLCRLTEQMVEGSPRFASLPLHLRQQLDRFLDAMCESLARLNQSLTPRQKSQIVAAYQGAVSLLARDGWLTSAQAAQLITMSKAL